MAVGQTGERKVQIVVLSDPSARKHCYSTRYFIVTKDKLLVKKDTLPNAFQQDNNHYYKTQQL